MAKVNKYGRQIFLSRQEIIDLRDLVGDKILELSDYINQLEDDLKYIDGPHSSMSLAEELSNAKARRARLEKMVDDDKGKLWFYVERESEL